MASGHALHDMFQMSVATPMLVIVVCLLVVIIMRRCFEQKMKDWGYVISGNVLTVDENLPNFFDAVRRPDREWFVKESRHFRKFYKFSFANKVTVDYIDGLQKLPKKEL